MAIQDSQVRVAIQDQLATAAILVTAAIRDIQAKVDSRVRVAIQESADIQVQQVLHQVAIRDIQAKVAIQDSPVKVAIQDSQVKVATQVQADILDTADIQVKVATLVIQDSPVQQVVH